MSEVVIYIRNTFWRSFLLFHIYLFVSCFLEIVLNQDVGYIFCLFCLGVRCCFESETHSGNNFVPHLFVYFVWDIRSCFGSEMPSGDSCFVPYLFVYFIWVSEVNL